MMQSAITLMLSVGLSAAVASPAGALACQSGEPQACCCPASSTPSPCAVSCAKGLPAPVAITSPAPIRIAAAWDLDLVPFHASPPIVSGTTGLSQAARQVLHDPPRRRYLMACNLRL